MNFLLLMGLVTWYVTNFNVLGHKVQEYEALEAVTISTNSFSTNFFSTVASEESGNLVCSPFSAWMVLSMLAYGAEGNTGKELRSVLELPSDDYFALKGFRALIDTFPRYQNVDLSLASKVFLANNFEPEFTFKHGTETFFDAQAMSVNFSRPEETSWIINKWAEKQTNGRIKDLVKPYNFDNSMILVLANAVYFKGEWENKFDAAETKSRPFHVSRNEQKDVETMYRFGSYGYGELPEFKAKFVEIPYKQGDSWVESMSMFIILPDEIDGLAELEMNFKNITLKSLNCGRRDVHVHLPKFNIESTIDLAAPLSKMGLNNIFLSGANFSGIAKNTPILVSKILQKAFIEVNEKGSEATAATDLQLTFHMLAPEKEPPVSFIADHPFISIIATQGMSPSILFITRYTGI